MARLNRQKGAEMFRAWHPRAEPRFVGLSFWSSGRRLKKVRLSNGKWGEWKRDGTWEVLRWRQVQHTLEQEGWWIEHVLSEKRRKKQALP